MSDERDFEQVAELLIGELNKSGLIANKGKTEEAAADGWHATLATWSVGRPEISIWFDRWLEKPVEKPERHFWFGFEGKKQEVRRLFKDVEGQLEEQYKAKPAKWKHSVFEDDERLPVDVVVKNHKGLVYETYRGGASYLGMYDIGSNGPSKRNLIKLVDEAVTFILNTIHYADAADARRHGSTDYETTTIGRRGQWLFRRRLETHWGSACAVTGCTVPEALRASHIKPWKRFKSLRLNPNNGLLLTATIDALFDQYLVSFDDDGKMLLVPKISAEDRKRLMLAGMKLSKPLSSKQRKNLSWHRKEAKRRWNCKLLPNAA
jgi:hypothetical protein